MNISIVNEKIVFWRDASSALRPAAAAVGSASPPACTLRALAMTFFWLGQITSHTLANIVEREQRCRWRCSCRAVLFQ